MVRQTSEGPDRNHFYQLGKSLLAITMPRANCLVLLLNAYIAGLHDHFNRGLLSVHVNRLILMTDTTNSKDCLQFCSGGKDFGLEAEPSQSTWHVSDGSKQPSVTTGNAK